LKREAKDYIVFPLDVPTPDEAVRFVRLLADRVGLFKVGLELFIASGPDIVREIHGIAGRKVFLDLKLHDIPATVRRSFLAASRHGPRFVTVHCDQGGGLLREVAEDNPGGTRILAVSLLTSLGPEDLERLGHRERYVRDPSSLVLEKARIASEAGCHGLICSGWEAARVKQELGDDFVVMTPGIRPEWTLVDGDDQKRVVTPRRAVTAGADYLVVGRPIRDSEDPAVAAERIAEEISDVL
jgi:orotidine-5'-phosphate decarboxylase